MTFLLGKFRLLSLSGTVWWLGLALSAVVALLFYRVTAVSVERDAMAAFTVQTRTARQSIDAQIRANVDLLTGTAALFQVSGTPTRSEFEDYVRRLALPRHFPAIETLTVAQYVTEAQRGAFERRAAHENQQGMQAYPPLRIVPAGRRSSYSILSYVEPAERRRELYGRDIAANPARARALDASRDSGDASLSDRPILLPERPGMIGLAMRIPLYRKNAPLTSVAARRAAYLGSVGIGFNLQVLLGQVLQQSGNSALHLKLYDGGTATAAPSLQPMPGDVLLFDHHPATRGNTWLLAGWHTDGGEDDFVSDMPIDYNGRLWKAHFSTPKRAMYTDFDAYCPWLALGAGFLGTLTFFILLHTLSSARLRATQMAKAMTQRLRDSQVKLEMSHEQLRRLAAHAEQIKEEERKRIAREIHDDLGQNLLVLRIEADVLAARTSHHHPRLHARARSTLTHIDATIKSVRHIINDLRPAVLDLGLTAAVEWQIAEFRRRSGIACEFDDHDHDIHVGDHCATALFRILQESLSNISQHAAASMVRVELWRNADAVSMSVSDNGVGMHIDAGRKRDSFGLVGIEERVKLLGGECLLDSSPGAGMTVRVTVPLKGNTASYRAELAVVGADSTAPP